MEMDAGDNRGGEEAWLALPTDTADNETSTRLADQRVHLWALILEARHLPFRIERGEKGLTLLVPERSFATTLEELRLFEKENRGWPSPRPPATPVTENTLVTISVLILLATFHNLTLIGFSMFGNLPVNWVAIGNAHVEKIMGGEWWRLVTALTLHADWVHLFSNLTIGGLFIVLLCREIGSGPAWCLLLASGILGNLANAFMQMPEHRSVGASTLVFGAVGILASLTVVRYRGQLQKRWPLPIAAALALLALLGTEGKQTDLGAHLFGLLFGILLGLVAEYLIEKLGRPGRRLNALLASLSAVIVIAAWGAAVVYGG